MLKSVSNFTITTPMAKATCSKNRLLFNEKKGKRFISRFTGTLSLPQVKHLFENTNWIILVDTENTNYIFKPLNSTKRKVDSLRKAIFDSLKE